MKFTVEKLGRRIQELEKYIYADRERILGIKYRPGDFPEGADPQLDDGDWEDFPIGGRWGGRMVSAWFRAKVAILPRFKGRKVCLRLIPGKGSGLVGAESLAFLDGHPFQGLDPHRSEVLLANPARGDEKYVLAIKAFSGMKEEDRTFEVAEVAVIDEATEAFYFNARVAYEVATLLDTNSLERAEILNRLNEAFNMVDYRIPGSEGFYASIRDANDHLEKSLYQRRRAGTVAKALCVGHTHIDVAWLWPLARTREKAARSFATALRLMEAYPEYHFLQSQPQLYKFVKEDYPEIYEGIKRRVKEGRWEATGGMWVESDCNVTSGESLVRQFLFGKRFFRREFGAENRLLWLPDVFGYNWALPQIMKKCGIDYFMTTKISWNQYNRLPYDTFLWRGVDGTEVLTHFITTTAEGVWFATYNGDLAPKAIKGAWDNYQQKNINDEVLVSFGWGDGGGGPTKEMLENARRLKDLPGTPKVEIGRAEDFFRRLEERVKDNPELPVWNGELYLEYHRGTYTTMAKNKRYNRQSEILYHNAELLSTMNFMDTGKYPTEDLNRGWELILLNQFHDIIPGSSIKEVYEESHRQYEEILRIGKKVLKSATDEIAGRIDLEEDSIVIFNPLSWERDDLVEVEAGEEDLAILDDDGNEIERQVVEEEGRRKMLFYARGVPSKGYKSFRIRRGEAPKRIHSEIEVTPRSMENRFFKIEIAPDGTLSSIYDKINRREVLSPGESGNLFQAFEDKPLGNDAWDIDIFYQDKCWELRDLDGIEVIEEGPLRGGVRIKRRFSNSLIAQKIYIYRDIPRIDFSTYVDWHETQVLLKVAFPVDIHSTRATYEIQFGNVERPTHWNTSWDYARFEVCGHKWADLSEGDYGVSLLNDCKYGHDIKDNRIRLTLLKSPIHPNPEADRGEHQFTYSLYPHSGDWRQGGTVRRGYELNYPLIAKVEGKHKGQLPPRDSFVRVDKPNVVAETVKKAEDDDGIIVRLYECYNQRGPVTLTFSRPLASAVECNLMEEGGEAVDFDGNNLSFRIKPYEIKTFKLKFKV
ncbi:MAG: alpha-mannosidase [bacterium]